ncbi:MAG TPA: hypothetical protein GX747_00850 [Tenericutes bacterium]|nr:hypothetical protein [Mycoplasmatota bacterium]
MRKIVILFFCIMVVGCQVVKDLNNSPIKRTEEFFNKYQTLDKDVMDDLYNVISNEKMFNEEQRERYEKLMSNHYKNLVYDIKEDKIDGNNAIVTVEITVRDYSKVLNEANLMITNNDEDFYDENNVFNQVKYVDYLLDKLEEVNEKVKYTLDITLTQKDKMWTVDSMTETNEKKINGAYMY